MECEIFTIFLKYVQHRCTSHTETNPVINIYIHIRKMFSTIQTCEKEKSMVVIWNGSNTQTEVKLFIGLVYYTFPFLAM